MNTTDEKSRMQRITITLDAFETSPRELERVARLAARLGAELEGVFVEDLDLIQLVGLPFLREVRSASLAVEALNLGRLEEELRVLARRAERTMAEHANRHGAAWCFRVWRGSIEHDLLASTPDADARFEEMTLFIQAAISEELTAAADQVEKVVRSIRGQTEKRQLEL